MHASLQEVMDELARLTEAAPSPDRALRRAIATGHMRGRAPPWRRVELHPVQTDRQGLRLKITCLDATQAHSQVIPFGREAVAAVADIFGQGYGQWHLESDAATWQARVTKRGHAQIHRQPGPPGETADGPTPAGPRGEVSPPTHNRPKARLLGADDPLWSALGMTAAGGGIRPTAQRKYRQVDAFLRHLASALSAHPPPEGPLTVVDLGCGNAALTFAAHRYLTEVRGLQVSLVGADLKDQAIARNSALARALGCQNVKFVRGSIALACLPRADIVLALHACDTATDEALARAIGWQAHLILASPCCHHDVQRQLAGRPAPAPYSPIARHGILRERLADVLTDACRAACLDAQGYSCEVVEFTSADQTPRNSLLRAVRRGSARAPARAKEAAAYAQLKADWGITPHLERLLSVQEAPASP